MMDPLLFLFSRVEALLPYDSRSVWCMNSMCQIEVVRPDYDSLPIPQAHKKVGLSLRLEIPLRTHIIELEGGYIIMAAAILHVE